MKFNKIAIGFLLVASSLNLYGCSKLSAKQQESTIAALEALGKLSAATEVGVSYQQYGGLLIDAKAKVNSACALLPEGDLKKNLADSIQAYADAQTYWSGTLAEKAVPDAGIGATLLTKYQVPPAKLVFGGDRNGTLTIVWKSAETSRQLAVQMAFR